MTPEQCRAARGWLALTPSRLAELAQVPEAAIVAFEAGQPSHDLAAIGAARDALEAAGIGFTFVLDGDGARPSGITFTAASKRITS